MLKKRLFILTVMLCLLILSYGKPAYADAGGACLGQWSECRQQCVEVATTIGGLIGCYGFCDNQRNACLGKMAMLEEGGSY